MTSRADRLTMRRFRYRTLAVSLAVCMVFAVFIPMWVAHGDVATTETVYACVRSNGDVRYNTLQIVPITTCPSSSDHIVSWLTTRSGSSTTTSTVAPTTTTVAPTTTTTSVGPTSTTTTTVPSGGGGTCTNPIYSSSNAQAAYNTDPGPVENWWVNNDAWSGSHGPQTINVCSESSWTAVSNQPNNCQGCVQTYPDTEYDVGGRDGHTTKPISAFTNITSTFSEVFPTGGNWDAGYDLWTNNWSNETMIWNEWQGAQQYWPNLARTNGVALTLAGVPYHFYANGSELMFFRDTQVKSGSVDLLAAFQWEVAHGYAKATDVPTQLEYGVEICYTGGSAMTFPMTGLTMSVS